MITISVRYNECMIEGMMSRYKEICISLFGCKVFVFSRAVPTNLDEEISIN